MTTTSPFPLRCLTALLSLALTSLSLTCRAAPPAVTDITLATDARTGVRVVSGTIELPRGGDWYIENPYIEQHGMIEIFLRSDEDLEAEEATGRMAKLMDRRAIQDRRSELRQLFYSCREYARENQGKGPAALSELTDGKVDIADANRQERIKEIASGTHLLPRVTIVTRNDKGEWRGRPENDEPLIIDLTPAIDDGKHWIISNRSFAERVEIDPELVKRLGITIEPQATPHGERDGSGTATTPAQLYARLTGDPGKATLTVRDYFTDEDLKIEWDTRSPGEGDGMICHQWAEQRLWHLDDSVRRDAPIAYTWAERIIDQYQLQDSYGDFRPELRGAMGLRERGSGRTANVMGILGGRAAIRETLQLRNLRAMAENAEDWKPSLPVDDIKGVEVKAHPFEAMLGDQAGGSLPLAEWLPTDNFMVYLPQPDKLFSLLGGGSSFIFQTGEGITGRSASYQLKERYREAFGLSEEIMKRFLESGAIEEMAITVPDLFFIEGTEMSVVMRTGKPLLTTAALALVGIPPGNGQTVKENRHGEPVYWVRRGPMLIISTSQNEVNAILDARKTGNNLGKSAELRYMLTQVPLNAETAVYSYFSDPFIRRLVGPRTKIGQQRRILARAELEEASAGSLLAAFDGHQADAFDLGFLRDHGYIRPAVYVTDMELDDQSTSSSEFYGTAARMTSLDDQPLDLVSEAEKKAYDDYLQQYNRYWRRFFDPIAIRYDQKADGEHEVETFILPLIDNSLYAGLRRFLPQQDEQPPLQVPVLEPQPIAMISCNLNEEAWLGTLEGFMDSFESVLGLDPALLDYIGPDLHLALQDADPILTMGNGELQGMLGQFAGFNRGGMASIGLLVSILTRPCTIHVGLEEPEKVRQLLAKMTWPPDEDNDFLGGFGNGSLYQITGQQKWIYKYSVESLITLRFGIEVQDRYLVINNQPFSNPSQVTGSELAPNGAAYLELNPEICEKQLPALFFSAAEKARVNTMSGSACLVPLMASGAATDIPGAGRRHRALFGFEPLHPAGGSWTWNADTGEMVSSLYGSPWQYQQPEFDPENKEVGLLRGVPDVKIGMQFEQDGLRSTIRWRTEKKAP